MAVSSPVSGRTSSTASGPAPSPPGSTAASNTSILRSGTRAKVSPSERPPARSGPLTRPDPTGPPRPCRSGRPPPASSAVPHQAGRVARLVVEHEVLVGTHPPVGPSSRAEASTSGTPGPGVHRSTARTAAVSSGTFRALQHRVRHGRHPAWPPPRRTTRGGTASGPAPRLARRLGSPPAGPRLSALPGAPAPRSAGTPALRPTAAWPRTSAPRTGCRSLRPPHPLRGPGPLPVPRCGHTAPRLVRPRGDIRCSRRRGTGDASAYVLLPATRHQSDPDTTTGTPPPYGDITCVISGISQPLPVPGSSTGSPASSTPPPRRRCCRWPSGDPLQPRHPPPPGRDILKQVARGVVSMVLCLEDSIGDGDVEAAGRTSSTSSPTWKRTAGNSP